MIYHLPDEDSTRVDLSHDELCDVIGAMWRWTRETDRAGEPLMVSSLGDSAASAVPLPEVWEWHGPLLHLPEPPAAARVREWKAKPMPHLPRRPVGGWAA